MTLFRDLEAGNKFTVNKVNYLKLTSHKSAAVMSWKWRGEHVHFTPSIEVKRLEDTKSMDQILDDMCERMAANAYKGDTWRHESLGYLLRRVQEELGELIQCLCNQESTYQVRNEAADVANFLWMLVEVYEAKLR